MGTKTEYTCDWCKKTFLNQSKVRVHILTHTGERPLMCEVCGQLFKFKNNLKTHIEAHRRRSLGLPCEESELPLKHQCSYCGKRFRTKTKLKLHVRSHTGEKPFQCDVCPRNFAARCKLLNHLKTHEQANKREKTTLSEKYDCNGGGKIRVCPECGKQFNHKSHFDRHMLVHDKQFACTFCSAVFALDSSLQRHLEKHNKRLNKATHGSKTTKNTKKKQP